MTNVTQAVILAGGRGSRLRPYTDNTPKPMLPIQGKPFLAYIIELLKKNDIKRIVILVGYLHEKIEEYFGDGRSFGVFIRYCRSPVETDTGTRIQVALPILDDTFLLLYGDNYWPFRKEESLRQYDRMHASAMVTVYSNFDRTSKGNMRLDEMGHVVAYDPLRSRGDLPGVDVGYFILKKTILSRLPNTNFSFERVIIPRLIRRRHLAGFLTHHKYYSLSTPDRIPMIEEYFRPKKTLILDRDGVINKRPPKGTYVRTWDEFTFLPRVKAALANAGKKGYDLYILTNQPGIARGVVTQRNLDDIHKNLTRELLKEGVVISDILVCPHGWDEGCFCRKPQAGLFYLLASKHHINLRECISVGDDVRDSEAAKRAGCAAIYTDIFDAVKNL